MQQTIFFLTLLISSSLFAKTDKKNVPKLAALICEKEIFQTIGQAGPKGEWKNILPVKGFLINRKIATKKRGEWIYLFANYKRTVLIQDNLLIKKDFIFTKKNKCAPDIKVNLKIENISDAPAGELFLDSDLEKLLQKSKENKSSGIIYFWSPHMPFSTAGIKELERVAKKEKVELTILLDPYADDEVVAKKAKELKLPKKYLLKFYSNELFQMEVDVHYPSYIMYKNGSFSSPLIPGYDTEEEMIHFIRKYKQDV